MLAWAVVDKNDRLRWWYQESGGLGEQSQQYDTFRLKRDALAARRAWDQSEAYRGPHKVIRVEITEVE